MELAIKLENLTKEFDTLIAVDSISFTVNKGDIFGFLGPNGAGKTTTIRMLTGMIAPTSGHGSVAGLPIDRNVEELHAHIGLLTETPGFYERFSAERNLEFFAGFYSGIHIPAQVEKYLKLVGLWERRKEKVRVFSRGMKQRLALARALLHEPDVIFLDEPTSGLDPEAALDVRNKISQLKQEGRTIFLSTHNLSEAETLCDHIAVIKTKLVAIDTPSGLRNRLFKREVIIEMDSVKPDLFENLKKMEFIISARHDGKKVIIEMEDVEKNRPILIKSIVDSGGMVQNVYDQRHSLEEVYMTLVSENDYQAHS